MRETATISGGEIGNGHVYYNQYYGEVAEWLKAHAWKACIRATVSQVRILFSPPDKIASARTLFYLLSATEER